MQAMWWVPLLTAFGLAFALAALQSIQNQISRDRPRVYRRQYLKLVAATERLTMEINQLAGLVETARSKQLWDYFEGCLRLQENLITMFKKLSPYGNDLSIIQSAQYLLRDCQERVKRTKKGVARNAKGREVDLSKLFGFRRPMPTGCYFCSRPFVYSGFKKVRARIDGDVRQVHSCDKCFGEFKRNKKVKVLYFVKDGSPVHWADVSEYNPIHDFWNLNRKSVLMKSSKLEFVFDKDDP